MCVHVHVDVCVEGRVQGCKFAAGACLVFAGHELHGKTEMYFVGQLLPRFSQFQARHEQVEWRGLQPGCKMPSS